ncbi:MAG: DMT family transporter [Trueperaceae bacterium]|nr:DMT family transporter [Trueperaceae bacterium]
MNSNRDNLKGVSFLVLAMLIFSLQNISVKWIGGDYSVLQIVTFRSLVALPLTLLFFRFEGNRGLPKTRRYGPQYLRGGLLFLSYTTHFMGLAALPLADIESIRFSAPLMITSLSVFLLGERVSARHWLALAIGFCGILFVVKPGAPSFNLGSIFILFSVLCYALNVILTRRLRTTDSSATMAYYSSLVYLLASLILIPLPMLVGEMPNLHPSLAFLLRSWTMPTLLDWLIMSGLGLVWAAGMFFMAKAYSTAQATVVAPFEYASLPINVMWGFVIWREVPTWVTLAGALLTLTSGLYILLNKNR